MDVTGSGARLPSHRQYRKSKAERQQLHQQQTVQGAYQPYQNPQLFDDTSTHPPQAVYGNQYAGPPSYGGDTYTGNFPGAQFLADPMANMAMAYGQNLVGQGRNLVDQNLEKYVPVSKLKYYFAVDTSYVWKKLIILLFPFSHTDWSMKYNHDEPVAPRYEINAPDLYIPVMAFVTYILMAGVTLGTQNRFAPDQLGIHASSAMVWLILEVLALMLTMYIMNIQTDLGYLDLVAYSGYKYTGMIASLGAGMLLHKMGYYCALGYTSLSLAFFLVRTLRIQILPKASGDHLLHGNKRRMYLLIMIAFMQPFLMFWLTCHLVD